MILRNKSRETTKRRQKREATSPLWQQRARGVAVVRRDDAPASPTSSLFSRRIRNFGLDLAPSSKIFWSEKSPPMSTLKSLTARHCLFSDVSFTVELGCCQKSMFLGRLRQFRSTTRRLLSNASGSTSTAIQVQEYRVRDNHKSTTKQSVTIYTPSEGGWAKIKRKQAEITGGTGDNTRILDSVRTNVITHFLPARYPESVADGYARFAGLGFCASIAGSAAMVLSTQTLLLAVGVVGSAQKASVMAGALNWVLKDGIGQLGGVWFASRMSRAGSAKFDADPKTWRIVAAVCLDGATLLEILSPLVPSFLVLPIASVANIGKNIGFLTASASRAALHQSMAISGNLADLTAKAGSQSLAASLVGTAVGIGLSPVLGDVTNFALGFVCLSAVHQGCNYASLKAAPLFHLNRHRLNILCGHFVSTKRTLTPHEVAEREFILPWMKKDETHKWLWVGTNLDVMCPDGPEELDDLLAACTGEQYLIGIVEGRIHLVFLTDAQGTDLIRGMLHTHYLHRSGANKEETLAVDRISETHELVRQNADELIRKMEQVEWKVGTDYTSVESSKAVRFEIEKS
jgi:hypothetical protein